MSYKCVKGMEEESYRVPCEVAEKCLRKFLELGKADRRRLVKSGDFVSAYNLLGRFWYSQRKIMFPGNNSGDLLRLVEETEAFQELKENERDWLGFEIPR